MCKNMFLYFFENPWSDRTPSGAKIVHTSSARVKKIKNDQYFIRGPSIFENRVPMLHGKPIFFWFSLWICSKTWFLQHLSSENAIFYKDAWCQLDENHDFATSKMCFPLETCAKNENHDFLMKLSKLDKNENLIATSGESKKKWKSKMNTNNPFGGLTKKHY